MSTEDKAVAGERQPRKKGTVVFSQKDFPRVPISETVPVLKLIYDNVAAGTVSFEDIAKLMGSSPNTTKTKYIIWGAEAYGLIIKEENSEYKLSETGRKIIAPTYQGEDEEALRKAILIPTILSKFYTEANTYPLPQEPFLLSKLENKYNIPRDRIEEAKNIIIENAKLAKILIRKEEDKKEYILLDPPAEKKKEVSILKDEIQQEKVNDNVCPQSENDTFETVCFITCPIGEEDSVERKHSDMILKHLIEPVVQKHGLIAVRADKIERSGLINQQILNYLVKSRLCIADLSFNNPNVFYELGVRHTCQLPSIPIIRKGDKIPFDVSQGRTIKIDTSDPYTLIDRIESAKKELDEYITGIIANPKEYNDDNPIKVYLPSLKVSI